MDPRSRSGTSVSNIHLKLEICNFQTNIFSQDAVNSSIKLPSSSIRIARRSIYITASVQRLSVLILLPIPGLCLFPTFAAPPLYVPLSNILSKYLVLAIVQGSQLIQLSCFIHIIFQQLLLYKYRCKCIFSSFQPCFRSEYLRSIGIQVVQMFRTCSFYWSRAFHLLLSRSFPVKILLQNSFT